MKFISHIEQDILFVHFAHSGGILELSEGIYRVAQKKVLLFDSV